VLWLADASAAVLAFMRQHSIAVTWGRSDLASSDMMSLETRQRVSFRFQNETFRPS